MSQYLVWEVQKNSKARGRVFSTKDMKRSLEREGCFFLPHVVPFLMYVVYELDNEDPKQVRKKVDRAINRIAPRCTRVFKQVWTDLDQLPYNPEGAQCVGHPNKA